MVKIKFILVMIGSWPVVTPTTF